MKYFKLKTYLPFQLKVKSATPILLQVLALVSLALLIGCFKPRTHSTSDVEGAGSIDKGAEAHATYFVGEVTGKSEVADLMTDFSIPTSRNYNFKACVTDKRTQEPVRGHRFEITAGTQKIETQTDTYGCLKWAETISFSFFAKEQYLPIHRQMTAKGIQVGTRDLKIAIDPWNFSGVASDVVDLNYGTLPSIYLANEGDVNAILSGETPSPKQPQLFPNLLTFESAPPDHPATSDGVARKLIATFKPQLLVRDLQNQIQSYSLTDAHLKLSLALATTTSSGGVAKNYLLWQTSRPLTVFKEQDTFKAFSDILLTHVSSTGPMLIAIRAEASDPLTGRVRSFDALYEANFYGTFLANGILSVGLRQDNRSGGKALRLSPSQIRFNYQSFLNSTPTVSGSAPGQTYKSQPLPVPGNSLAAQAAPSGQPGVASGLVLATRSGQRDLAPDNSLTDTPSDPSGLSAIRAFRMSVAKILLLGPLPGETATRRTMHFQGKVCFTDVANGNRPASDVEFLVTKIDGSVKAYRTLNNPGGDDGCLYWEDDIAHAYYQSEHFILVPLKISQSSGYTEVRTLALDPWDKTNTVSMDSMVEPEFIQSVNQRPAVPSRLLVDNFTLDTAGAPRFDEVDKFLSLIINKTEQLRLSARVQRYSNLAFGLSSPPEILRDGVYLIRLMVDASFVNPDGQWQDILMAMKGRERLARVRGGDLKMMVDFPIRDIRLMRARSNLLFEILPIDQSLLTADELVTLNSNRNLDALVDATSGLVSPTFVGPLFVRDEYGAAAVLPTDDLQGNLTGNPDDAQNLSQLKQVLSPFAGRTFKDLVPRLNKQEADLQARNQLQATISTVVKNANLDYIPFMNEGAIVQKDPGLAQNNTNFTFPNAANQLLQALNHLSDQAKLSTPRGQWLMLDGASARTLGPQDLYNLVDPFGADDPEVNARFCSLFIDQAARTISGETDSFSSRTLYNDCVRDVVANKNAGGSLVKQKLLRVFQHGSPTGAEGTPLSINVGADISMSHSDSTSHGWSFGWSPTSMVSSIVSGAGSILKLPGLKFLDIPAMLGFSARYGYDKTASDAANQSANLGSNTTLNLEQLQVDMSVLSYEPCTVLRLSPTFWQAHESTLKGYNPKRDETESFDLAERGLMLCLGTTSTKPVQITEHYFSLGQAFYDETILDKGSLSNNPWLLSIRGLSDFGNLMTFLQAKKSDATTATNPMTIPVERLKRAYQGYIYTAPTFYVVDPANPPRLL